MASGISHRIDVTVSWGDCDPAGIVFYPHYFEWFDRGTHRLLESVGLDHHTITETYDAVGLSLVDAQASFRAPATYDARLEIESRVAKIGTSSLTVTHTITAEGETLVEGREVRVWIVREGEELRGAPIPDEVRGRLDG